VRLLFGKIFCSSILNSSETEKFPVLEEGGEKDIALEHELSNGEFHVACIFIKIQRLTQTFLRESL
jgi:hypothetical protein